MSSDPMAASLRRAELGLLSLAVAVDGLASLALRASEGPVKPQPGLLVLFLGFAGLAALAHLVVRRTAPLADPLLLPIATVLTGLGLVMIERLDLAAARGDGQAVSHHAHRADGVLQLVWMGLGVLVLTGVLLACRDHSKLARYPYVLAMLGLTLLIMPALPLIGTTINGARLWLRVGPFTVQPAEFAKLILIMAFASYLTTHRDVLSLTSRSWAGINFPRGRDAGPLLLVWAASLAVLTLEHDLGLSVLFFGVFVAMLYISTERWQWVLGAGLLAILGLAASFLLVHNVHNRIEVWLHPMRDPQGANFQPLQALYGLGTGGITGTGLGQGSPQFVPFAKTDFMLSSLGEELGLIGVMAVIVCFALLVERGFHIALNCRDNFGTLLAAGLSVVLGLQVFFIVGGVTGLIPLTGVTLPWMSYGGSSVLSNWALIALLLRISNSNQVTAPHYVNPNELLRQLADTQTRVVRR
jgi:cell division protein FtsW (lipid II flippase)